jgi:hypothetical protein
MHNIRRTAVYAIRTYGGVGGGSRKASPYPDRTALIQAPSSAGSVSSVVTLHTLCPQALMGNDQDQVRGGG